MSSLKTDTLSHHLSFIKSDYKRILFLLIVPVVVSFFYLPTFFLLIATFILPRSILWLVLLPLISFAAAFIIQLRSPQKPDYQPNFKASISFTLHLLFINAFVEELFFRGFLMNLFLLLTNSSVLAIIISAAVFGLYHIPIFHWNRTQAFIAFLGGLFFGAVYYFSDSIFIAWFVHASADLGLVHEGLVGYYVWTRIRAKEIN